MFLFAPSPQPVLTLDGQRNVFFPVRRLLSYSETEGETVLVADRIETCSEKRREELVLGAQDCVSVFLGAAFAPKSETPYGYVAGVMVCNTEPLARLYVSPMVPSTRTVNPVDSYASLSVEKGFCVSENVLTLLGNLNETMGYFLAMENVRGGDVLLVKKTLTLENLPSELSFGVNAVGHVHFSLSCL